MNKRFLIIIAVLAIVFGGIFWFTRHKSSSSSGNSNAQPTNHVKGGGAKKVTLTEYGDYQCPACGAYFPVVNQVYDKFQNDIYFQFRNFPLTQIHQNAFAGARAAEAADKQGKFWEMHDLLYQENDKYYAAQNQGQTYNTWINSSNPATYFAQYAQQLGLNVTQFNQDLQSQAVNDSIEADLKVANDSGFNATPTFLINGKKIDNPPDQASFEKVIQDAINAQNK